MCTLGSSLFTGLSGFREVLLWGIIRSKSGSTFTITFNTRQVYNLFQNLWKNVLVFPQVKMVFQHQFLNGQEAGSYCTVTCKGNL